MFYCVFQLLSAQPILILIIVGLGVLSTVGLGSYILASRLLPLVLFGLLSYLEPVLLTFASMLLGERIAADEWWTYVPIWMAVVILTIEGALRILKQRYQAHQLNRNIRALAALKQDKK